MSSRKPSNATNRSSSHRSYRCAVRTCSMTISFSSPSSCMFDRGCAPCIRTFATISLVRTSFSLDGISSLIQSYRQHHNREFLRQDCRGDRLGCTERPGNVLSAAVLHRGQSRMKNLSVSTTMIAASFVAGDECNSEDSRLASLSLPWLTSRHCSPFPTRSDHQTALGQFTARQSIDRSRPPSRTQWSTTSSTSFTGTSPTINRGRSFPRSFRS